MAKEFKSGITKPTDAEIFATTKGHPFKKCPNCGNSITSSQEYCLECHRLVDVGFGVTPRAPHPNFVDKDTQEKQSYPSGDHSGYSDHIPTQKFPPGKERM